MTQKISNKRNRTRPEFTRAVRLAQFERPVTNVEFIKSECSGISRLKPEFFQPLGSMAVIDSATASRVIYAHGAQEGLKKSRNAADSIRGMGGFVFSVASATPVTRKAIRGSGSRYLVQLEPSSDTMDKLSAQEEIVRFHLGSAYTPIRRIVAAATTSADQAELLAHKLNEKIHNLPGVALGEVQQTFADYQLY